MLKYLKSLLIKIQHKIKLKIKLNLIFLNKLMNNKNKDYFYPIRNKEFKLILYLQNFKVVVN